jgi:hypothetical protein
VQLLDAGLHNLPSFFHGTRESCEWLVELRAHLSCILLVGLAHGFDFGADDIE